MATSTEQARALANRRWAHEGSAALDRYVEAVIRRAPALTNEQRDRIAAALRVRPVDER